MAERVMPPPTPRPWKPQPSDIGRLQEELARALREPQSFVIHTGPPTISTVLWWEGQRPYDQDVPEPDLPLLLVTWTD